MGDMSDVGERDKDSKRRIEQACCKSANQSTLAQKVRYPEPKTISREDFEMEKVRIESEYTNDIGLGGIYNKPLPEKLRNTRVFETGATRDADQTKLDYEGFLSPQVLRRFAEYMHECRLRNIPPGQELRSSDNWQKGIPKEAYMKSMLRHVMELWEEHRKGYREGIDRIDAIDQRILCAIMFNVMGYLYEDLNGR